MKFYTIIREIIRPICFLLMPRKYHNTECIPTEGPLIVCANHISYLDPVFIGLAVKQPIRFIAKKQACEAPIIGGILRALGAFPVDREGKDLTAIRTCMHILKDQQTLGIFPEGTRIIKGKVSSAKAGVALIAKRAKAPLLLVHIKPSKGRFRLFCRTDVYFSKPLEYDELCKDADYQSASENILSSIYALGE